MPIHHPALAKFAAANPSARFGAGTSSDEIATAEVVLGVRFPKMFRAYLAECGYLEFRSAEFYGLGIGVPAHLGIVENTLAERNEFHPHMPQRLVPFMPNGGGDHYCIDASSKDEDPPVVFWDHERGVDQQPQILAESFSSWLNQHTDEWV